MFAYKATVHTRNALLDFSSCCLEPRNWVSNKDSRVIGASTNRSDAVMAELFQVGSGDQRIEVE
jgi:hypothetical protein